MLKPLIKKVIYNSHFDLDSVFFFFRERDGTCFCFGTEIRSNRVGESDL